MGSKAARTVIVDDQILYRDGLRGLVESWPEFEVVGDAANGEEGVALCRRTNPDLVLLDLQMPVMDGIEAARIIRRDLPQTTIVILTVTSDDENVFAALQSGARGYILKDTPARQLRDRLRHVLRGGATLSDEVTGKVLDEFKYLRAGSAERSRINYPGADRLTDREKDILRLVAEGISNEEIGARLYLSVGTVKKRLATLMQKLDVENRVQLAAYAVRVGFAD